MSFFPSHLREEVEEEEEEEGEEEEEEEEDDDDRGFVPTTPRLPPPPSLLSLADLEKSRVEKARAKLAIRLPIIGRHLTHPPTHLPTHPLVNSSSSFTVSPIHAFAVAHSNHLLLFLFSHPISHSFKPSIHLSPL